MMLIKLYDKQMNFIRTIVEAKDLQITEELETGYKIAQFQLPYSVGFIQEEQKIEIDNYIYVVKEINMEDVDYYEVYCKPYFSGLLGKHIDSLTGYSYSLSTALAEVLEDTGWTYQFMEDIIGVYTLNIERSSALDAVSALGDLFDVDFAFDTKEKIIKVWNKRGSFVETFLFNETTLRECQVQSSTYDLITRLIPIGKDGITITAINGSSWLEDYSYTDEVIVGYWVQTGISNKDDLYKLAQDKIEDCSKPQITYKIKAIALNSLVSVGDSIRIIDEIKGIDKIERIAKTVTYPDKQEESYVELGNPITSFDDIYKSLEAAQEIVNKDTLRNLTELNKNYE